MKLADDSLWAKLKREGTTVESWHSLVDHSADVAAVVLALLEQPTIRRRLAATAGLADIAPIIRMRLAALAFLHDIGKANRGFRARVDPAAPLVGHINELAWLFVDPAAHELRDRLCCLLGLERVAEWFGVDTYAMLEAVFAHHGRPWRRGPLSGEEAPRYSRRYWERKGASDPIADLIRLREKLDLWFPSAFEAGLTMVAPPAFQHAFAGLLMLADWLGSDEQFFPFANGDCADRFSWALPKACEALATVGLAVEGKREALRAGRPDFHAAFDFDNPRPIQEAIGAPSANLLVLEAETGSGKTEAALWRFKLLFEAGLVDGVYFALPTRVAATQMFSRVKKFRDRIFPGPDCPGVVLAVPGQSRFDEAEARPLPEFGVQWSDDAQDTSARWAAEAPKRFLAATIAVGTLDQALLGAVRVKHAHLRGAALLRHLFVVDEVHASDTYSGALLKHLLRSHVAACGHALLLSATLGSAMRADLLGTPNEDYASATGVAYPALSWAEDGREVRLSIGRDGRSKAVAVEPEPLMQDEMAVAARALAAAREGAAVLVIRNTVGAAIDTTRAIETLAGEDSPLLFRVEGVPTLHHSRFAVEDRRRLDAAVEALFGYRRETGRGIVVVGSQTLEISLDLDADLLITDLCPVDVLLQRIGRLHRHQRARPDGVAVPRLVLLTPPDRDLLATRLTRYGLGPLKDGRGVYPDLRLTELTLRLIEQHPVWTIPDMNRCLVEAATHASRIDELEAEDPRWRQGGDMQSGHAFAQIQTAQSAHLDRTSSFTECVIPRDQHFGTRLGADDRAVLIEPARIGPFGAPVSMVKLPGFLARGIPPEAVPAKVVEIDGRISFEIGDSMFSYDRFGLLRGN